MKLLSKISIIATLLFSSSCAMLFNEKTVDISIDSNPRGADIVIEGKSYGQTPKTFKLEPKHYDVILTKEGYGSAQLKLESWVTARNGKCIADALGSMLIIPYYSFLFSGYCSDFKEKENLVNIPYQALRSNSRTRSANPGVKVSPSDIDYYYKQDVLNRSKNENSQQRGGHQLDHGYRIGY